MYLRYFILGGYGWLLVVIDCGWLWMVVDGWGWLWVVVDEWLWVVA